ncbi:MAG: hypothetical protein QOE45_234 [Frankiaceae bacterium]|jgi:hypothetical protein|nr:hypothetical protein [Frankiaceae bacterium]
MRLVAGLAAAVTLAAIGAVPASAAAPKPACNLVTDGKGDSIYNHVPGDSSVDLVGGDFASNAKTITAVIRVDKLVKTNPQAPLGQQYFVLFNVKGVPDLLTLSVGIYPTGDEYKFGYQAEDPNTGVNTSYTVGDAKGSYSEAKGELRISADIAKFPQGKKIKLGAQVTNLKVEARRVVGQRKVPSQDTPAGVRAPLGGLTLVFDDATGKNYTLGAKSCVAIGK